MLLCITLCDPDTICEIKIRNFKFLSFFCYIIVIWLVLIHLSLLLLLSPQQLTCSYSRLRYHFISWLTRISTRSLCQLCLWDALICLCLYALYFLLLFLSELLKSCFKLLIEWFFLLFRLFLCFCDHFFILFVVSQEEKIYQHVVSLRIWVIFLQKPTHKSTSLLICI